MDNGHVNDVLACAPAEGGLGSEFTITGRDFGNVQGVVKLGGKTCKVVSWSPAEIVVVAPTGLKEAGRYDLEVKRHDALMLQAPSAFSIITPKFLKASASADVEYVRPPSGFSRCVAGMYHKRRTFTIVGNGFGSIKGKVFASGPDGEEKRCLVRRWTDDYIDCFIPRILEKNASLSVRMVNRLGEVKADDFVAMSPPAKGVGKPYHWMSEEDADDNVKTVNFGGQTFMFYQAHGKAGFEINCRGWTELWYWEPDGKHITQVGRVDVWPVLVGQRLYVMFTKDTWMYTIQLDGNAVLTQDYKDRSNTTVKWHYCEGSGFIAYKDHRNMPVYNNYNQRLYLFSSDSSKTLTVAISQPITDYNHRGHFFNWENNAKRYPLNVRLSDAPAACMAYNPRAKANQILLAWRGEDGGFYFGFFDDKAMSVHDIGKIPETIKKWSPFLVSCQDGSAAVTWYGGSDGQVALVSAYFPEIWEKEGTPWKRIDWENSTTFREPRLGTWVKKDDDGNVYTTLWVYYFDNRNPGSADRCFGWHVADIGKVATKKRFDPVSWAALHQEGDTEWYWDLPILGVIDGGPPVCNLKNPATDKTGQLSFLNTQSLSETWEFKFKAGVFFAYAVPVVPGPFGEVHAGVSGGYSKEVSKTLGVEIVFPSRKEDNDTVWVLFMVPKTECAKLGYDSVWGNIFKGTRSSEITHVEVVDVTIHALPVARNEFKNRLFPQSRKYGDLKNYTERPPDDSNGYVHLGNDTRWNTGMGPLKMSMNETITEIQTAGLYVSFKVGYGKKDYISGGIEGEVSFTSTMKKSKSATVAATISNNAAAAIGDVVGAVYAVYWLGTKDSARGDCYWTPQGRQGRGDIPWFITYHISNIVYKK